MPGQRGGGVRRTWKGERCGDIYKWMQEVFTEPQKQRHGWGRHWGQEREHSQIENWKVAETETEGARGKERPQHIKMRQEAERSRHSEQDSAGPWETETEAPWERHQQWGREASPPWKGGLWGPGETRMSWRNRRWEGKKRDPEGTGVSVDPHGGTKTTAWEEPRRGEVWARVPSAGLGAPLTVQPPGRA